MPARTGNVTFVPGRGKLPRTKVRPKKTSRPPAEEVAGPYRSQSSVPSVRAQATPHEHRKVRPASTGDTSRGDRASRRAQRDAFKVKPLHAPTRAERRQAQAEKAVIRRLLSPRGTTGRTAPKVATATSRQPGSRDGWKPPSAAELAVERDVIKPLQDAGKLPEHPTTGQEIYQKIAEWGPTVITATPELKAGVEALQVGLRGASAGDAVIGGAKALSRITTPVKVASSEGRAALAARTAEKEAAKATGSGVRAAAARAANVVRRAGPKADAAAARKATGTLTRRETAAAAGVPLKAAKLAGGQTLPVVRGHEQAIVEEPGKTAATTLRIAPGVLTTPVGMAADVGLSVGRLASTAAHAAHVPGARNYSEEDILAPLKGQAKSQEEFAKQVASVVTSSDPEYVKKQVEDHLGLLLPAMAAPIVARAFKPAYARALERVRTRGELSRAARGVERRPLTEEPQHVSTLLEGRQQRIEEAKRAATTKHHAEIETSARGKRVLQEARKAKGPRDVVRELPKRRGRGTRKITVNPGDAVGFLARFGISRKVDDALLQIEHVHERLDHATAAELPKARLNTLDMTTYLLKHPEVLRDTHLWNAVDAYKAQAKSLTTSEPARVQPIMQAHANPELGQRDPAIRHFDRVPIKAREHTDATTRTELRKEIAADRQRLKRAAVKGDTEKVRELAGQITAKRQGLYHDLTPEERQAIVEELAEQDVTDPKVIAQHIREARAGKAAASDQELHDEYMKQAAGLIQHYGHEEPAFATQADVRSKGSPAVSATGGAIPKVPASIHQRTGHLQELGAVEESLPSLLRESIRVPVARRHIFGNMRDFINERASRFAGKTEITSREAGRLIDNGAFDPRHNILIPRQLYKRAFDALDRGDETQMGALREAMKGEAQQQIVSRIAHEKGRKYIVVPREAAAEFFAQTEKLSGAQNVVARANRATSRVILGTSPAWAAMQVLAEGTQAVAAVNPYRLYRGLQAFRKLPPEKQWAFQSWAGETPGVAIAPKDVQLGLRDGSMQEASDAFGVANKTVVGRGLKNFSTAELLGMLDRRKGGLYRRAIAAGKIDRDLNSKLTTFTRGMQNLWRRGDAISTELKGKPLDQQLSWFLEHPAEMKKVQGYLDDVMGNWNALTRHERTAASVVMFYPFLRMSLRWLLHSFPKQHPIKASILYYLGQQNANELAKLLHGDPSFFNWAMVPIHAGKGGRETSLVDLGRMAPGANSLVSGLGGATGGPAGAVGLQVVQPWMSAIVTAATGVGPLTGRQEEGAGYQALAQLLALPLPARLLNAGDVLPGQGRSESPTAKAFRQEGSEGLAATLRSSVAPVIPKDLSQEQRKVKLSKLLEEKYADPVPSTFTAEIVKAIFEGKGGKVDQRLVKKLAAAHKRAQAAGKKVSKLEGAILGEENGDFTEEQSKALEAILGGIFIPTHHKPNPFGLPSTSPDSLRKQFGLPSTSTADLKKQFGIE